MLSQVIKEINKSRSSISLDDLSRRLEVEPSALVGMLEYCVRKGILQRTDGTAVEGECVHEAGNCGVVCEGLDGCPFIVRMPNMYSMNTHEDQPD